MSSPFSFPTIEQIASAVFGQITKAISSFVSQVISGVGGVIGGIRTFIESGFNTIKQAIFNQLQYVIDQIAGLLVGIPSKIAGLLGGIQQALAPLFNSLTATFKGIIGTVNQAITGFVIPLLSQIPARITGAVGQVVSTLSGFFTPILNNILNTGRQLFSTLGNLPGQIYQQLLNVGSFLTDSIRSVIPSVTNALTPIHAIVTSGLQGTSDLISGFNQFAFQAGQQFEKLGKTVGELGKGFWDTILKGMDVAQRDIVNPILGLIGNTIERVRKIIHPTGSISPEAAIEQMHTAGLESIGAMALGHGLTIAAEVITAGQLDIATSQVLTTLKEAGISEYIKDYLFAEYDIGVRPAFRREILRRYEPLIPGAGDLINMVVKEAFVPELVTPAPDVFAKYMRENGYTKEWSDRYWSAHWRPLAFDQATEMFHRNIISEDDYIKRLIILDYRPKDVDLVKQLTFRLPNRIEARIMARFGLLTDEQITSIIRAEGVKEEFVEPLRVMMQEFNLTSTFTRQETAAIGGFTDGLMTEAQTRELLVQIKRPAKVIDQDIALARLKRQLEVKRDMISAINAASKKGVLTVQRAQQEYTKLGLDPDVVDEFIAVIQFNIDIATPKSAKKDGKVLTASQIAKGVNKNIIPLDEGLQAIAAQGYSAEDARTLIELSATTKQ